MNVQLDKGGPSTTILGSYQSLLLEYLRGLLKRPNPKFALYCVTNECVRTNTLLLPLSEVSTEAVSLTKVLVEEPSGTLYTFVQLQGTDSV